MMHSDNASLKAGYSVVAHVINLLMSLLIVLSTFLLFTQTALADSSCKTVSCTKNTPKWSKGWISNTCVKSCYQYSKCPKTDFKPYLNQDNTCVKCKTYKSNKPYFNPKTDQCVTQSTCQDQNGDINRKKGICACKPPHGYWDTKSTQCISKSNCIRESGRYLNKHKGTCISEAQCHKDGRVVNNGICITKSQCRNKDGSFVMVNKKNPRCVTKSQCIENYERYINKHKGTCISEAQCHKDNRVSKKKGICVKCKTYNSNEPYSNTKTNQCVTKSQCKNDKGVFFNNHNGTCVTKSQCHKDGRFANKKTGTCITKYQCNKYGRFANKKNGTCVTKSQCKKKGQYINKNNNTCVSSCPDNTLTAENQKLCYPSCSSNICFNGKHLHKGKCVKSCPDYLNVKQNKCVSSCPYDTVVHKKKCLSNCPNGKHMWKVGYDKHNQCVTQCQDQSQIVGKKPFLNKITNTCLSQCPKDTFVYDKKCLSSCPAGTHVSLRDGKAPQCVSDCKKPYLNTVNNTCVKNCPDDTIKQGNKCTLKCPADQHIWTKSNSPDKCVNACKGSESYLNTATNTCVSSCPNDMIQYKKNGKQFCSFICPKKGQHRLAQKGKPNKCVDQCKGTKKPYLNTKDNLCVSKAGCPDDMFLNKNRNTCQVGYCKPHKVAKKHNYIHNIVKINGQNFCGSRTHEGTESHILRCQFLDHYSICYPKGYGCPNGTHKSGGPRLRICTEECGTYQNAKNKNYLNPKTNKCVQNCPNGLHKLNRKPNEKPSQHKQTQTKVCVSSCPAGRPLNNPLNNEKKNKCVKPSECPSGRYYIPGVNKKICLRPSACPGGSYFYPNKNNPKNKKNRCVVSCPNGSHTGSRGNQCVDKPKCKKGKAYDPTSEACVKLDNCPNSYRYSSKKNKCVKPKNCPHHASKYDKCISNATSESECAKGYDYVPKKDKCIVN